MQNVELVEHNEGGNPVVFNTVNEGVKSPEYVNRRSSVMNSQLPMEYCRMFFKPAVLLHDIRNFKANYTLLSNCYFKNNEIIILNDLVRFCNNNTMPLYYIETNYENIIKRHFLFRNYTVIELKHYIYFDFYKALILQTKRKIWFLFGLLTPKERTAFFDMYIFDNFTDECVVM